ncbi:MAG TPA: zinc ribbon domain-containing protein [Bryobacteraceae bacterium]|nr:zinc ribbon domain-containing protein [Bryobacteraceae bacterium]
MPIYEYRCEDCGSKFEKLVRRTADAGAGELECPSCGQRHLRQELSVFAAPSSANGKAAEAPVCPSGRCSNPAMCGMN